MWIIDQGATLCVVQELHIQIPLTSYVGLILRSTVVATQVAVPLRIL